MTRINFPGWLGKSTYGPGPRPAAQWNKSALTVRVCHEDLFLEPSAVGLAGAKPQPIDILLAEPDEAVSDSMRLLFETAGFQVRATSDGTDLETLLHWQPPRCLVLASELTSTQISGNGIALLAQIRAHGITTPAIVTACQGGVPLAVEAMRAGATDFLEKPLLDARLLLTVKRVMNPPVSTLSTPPNSDRLRTP